MKNFTPILLITVSAVLFFFHLQPQYQNTMEVLQEREDYELALASAVELREVRDNLQTKLNSFSQDELDTLGVLIPNDFDLVRFVNDINGVATRYNISPRNIRESTEVVSLAESLHSATLSFSFETSHINFLRFIEDLERSLKVTDVTSLRIRTVSDELNTHSYEVSLKTYWVEEGV